MRRRTAICASKMRRGTRLNNWTSFSIGALQWQFQKCAYAARRRPFHCRMRVRFAGRVCASTAFPTIILIKGVQPDFAYVQLLAYPKEGDPVLWTSGGANVLTVYCKALMRVGGVAFLVTGVDHA